MARDHRLACAVLVLIASASGCVSWSRANLRCEWADDRGAALDAARRRDRWHLRDDVERAEEIAIRFGDAFRRTHGLLVVRQNRAECTSRLLIAVANYHELPLDAVLAVRGQRPVIVDLFVLLSFIALYVAIVRRLVSGLFDRIPADLTVPATVAMTVLSAMLGVASTMGLRGFATGLEVARLGDLHMSYRVGRLPWDRLGLESLLLFTGIGFVLAFSEFRRRRRRGGLAPL